ncbi:MAG: hypothetical protein AB7H80_00670 [Candidatus Kapaibacterium sp.]
MFEQEINETIQRITRDVLQDKTLISLIDILEEPQIPNRFKAFFETEVHWWVYTDDLTRRRDRRFDFAHPEISSLLNYLEQIQVKHARFERDEFLSVLDKAVKLSYNYICRPQTTLKWYIFRGEPTKSLGETLLRLNAFTDYPYFRTVFTDWVDRKREERPTFDSISAREFERITRRIDDQILLSSSVDELLEIMNPLFDFIGKGEGRSVPIDALIVFFDDKHIGKLVEFLEKEKEHRSHVTPESFVLLMDELLSSAEEEPDVDFSTVYQDDALDAVVRDHLQGDVVGERSITESPAYTHTPETIAFTDAPQSEVDSHGQESERSIDEESAENDQQDAIVSQEPEANLIEEETQHALSGEQLPSDSGVVEVEEEPKGEDFFIGLESLPVDSDIEETFADESDDDVEVREPIIDILIETTEINQIIVSAPVDVESESEEELESDAEVASLITEVEGTPLIDETEESEEETEEVVEEIEEASLNIEEVKEEEKFTEAETGEGEEEEYPLDEQAPDDDSEADERREEESTIDSSEESKEEAATIGDVRYHVDAMLERKVVKKIFGRDRSEYEKTLDLLNTAETWREASRILDELFIRFEVDPYSRTAIRFTDAIYGRYLTPVNGS